MEGKITPRVKAIGELLLYHNHNYVIEKASNYQENPYLNQKIKMFTGKVSLIRNLDVGASLALGADEQPVLADLGRKLKLVRDRATH